MFSPQRSGPAVSPTLLSSSPAPRSTSASSLPHPLTSPPQSAIFHQQNVRPVVSALGVGSTPPAYVVSERGASDSLVSPSAATDPAPSKLAPEPAHQPAQKPDTSKAAARTAQPHASTAETPSSSFTAVPQKSFLEHRSKKHRKNAHSIDSVPRQTILKALRSRPPPTSRMSGATSLDKLVACDTETQDERGTAQQRLSAALSEMQLTPHSLLASKMAALASPCFFHKKFDHAVNIDPVLDDMHDDERISHSRLMQTATSVREISKQLQRRPIRMTVRNVLIITKARDNELVLLTRELAEWLLCTPRNGSDVGVNVYVDHKLRASKRFDATSLVSREARFSSMLRFWTPDMCWTTPEQFDLVLTLGGDGTVLYTSWLFQRIVPPIVSFSLGSLGFLTNFEYGAYRDALDKILGDVGMRVNLRMRFTCTLYRYQPQAALGTPEHIEAEQFEVLNELVIDRGPSPYVSNLELYGDNNLLTVVQADGCIFSTPTGSTAYSLSAGGSLVHPDIPAILLTPICPHTLSFRPMLLNDSMLLRIAVPRGSRATAYCAFDGKGRVELRQGDHVSIAASQYPFPTVLAQPTDWFDSISRTLRWNTRGATQKAWDGAAADAVTGTANADAPTAAEPHFDIDFDTDDIDRDSGYSAEGSTAGPAPGLAEHDGSAKRVGLPPA